MTGYVLTGVVLVTIVVVYVVVTVWVFGLVDTARREME